MIARWMLGALAFSLFCAVAAWSAERALSAWRRPTRWPWVIAMLVATMWPVLAPLVLVSPASAMRESLRPGAVTQAFLPTDVVEPAARTGFALALERVATWAIAHDTTLLALWVVASALLFLQVLMAIRTLSRVQHRAQERELDGERVLVHDAVGPAVIGLLSPAIVLPAWLLSLDSALRELVLRHEREHCRAGDPRLVWMAVATTTLLPWNAALWWIAHRLRLAMEIDCDARTAQSPDERTRYAKLLLLIAQHKHSARFAPMLAVTTSQLSRRIRAMHRAPVRYPLLRTGVAGVAIVAAGVAACSPRIATNLTSPNAISAGTQAAATKAPAAVPDSLTADTATIKPFFDFQVDQPAVVRPGEKGPAYPDALRAAGVQGAVLAQFVVNIDGGVDVSTIKVLRSSDDGFADAVRTALGNMRFMPAMKDGQRVRQLVQQPFQFGMSEKAGARSTASVILNPSIDTTKPLFDFQLDQPAVMRSGSIGPAYPKALREAKVEGTVLAQFVLGTDGRADLNTFKVLKSDHPDFSEAVRVALETMQFEPARLKGQVVKQLMQQPFQFSIGK